jgi:hypothetical protein
MIFSIITTCTAIDLEILIFFSSVEMTVHVQTVGAAGTTVEWPRIEATARLEENKSDSLKRMSRGSFILLIYTYFFATSTFPWTLLVRPSVRLS